jgi:pimeloyl-ACP methyl ester carboxylesterase
MSKFLTAGRTAFLLSLLLLPAAFVSAFQQNAAPPNAEKKPIPTPTLPAPSPEPSPSPPPVATPPVAAAASGKTPIIIVPGLIGSELVNKSTGEGVWFHLQRAKTDDLRLPVSPNLARNRDNLVPRDILRNVRLIRFLPEIQIYDRLIEALKANGYTEGNWDAPASATDVFYVFPYDWRRDNVETARLLTRRIQTLKTKLKRPNLKFNVIAHSMGGLVSRYAAMYGDADLPAAGARRPRPTWAGARHFNKIFLVGTPNEGSLPSLNSLLNGFSFFGVAGLNLPFVQNLTKFDLFTIPAIYQLLPHADSARVFDENLKPLKIDLYNPTMWEKYGWAAYLDKDFKKNFAPSEQKNARAYLRVVLARAKRFQDALRATAVTKSPVPVYFFGSECKPTLDGMVIYRDAKKNVWRTIFKPDSFERADGTKVSNKELEPLLYSPGDGTVTKRSFLTAAIRNISHSEQTSFPVCEEHRNLTGNPEIQKNLLAMLDEK